MERKKRIKKILFENFQGCLIEVKDKSLLHRGHNNFNGKNETHFLILLNLNKTSNMKKIDIHRKINNLLKNEFFSGLHALEIKIKN